MLYILRASIPNQAYFGLSQHGSPKYLNSQVTEKVRNNPPTSAAQRTFFKMYAPGTPTTSSLTILGWDSAETRFPDNSCTSIALCKAVMVDLGGVVKTTCVADIWVVTEEE